MRSVLAILLVAFVAGWADGKGAFQAAPADVVALKAEVADLKRELALVKNQVFHNTSPWRMLEHVEWNPDDVMSVDRMKLALREDFVNHGGLLRLPINGKMYEIPKGVFVDFLPPKWTVVGTWPPRE